MVPQGTFAAGGVVSIRGSEERQCDLACTRCNAVHIPMVHLFHPGQTPRPGSRARGEVEVVWIGLSAAKYSKKLSTPIISIPLAPPLP